MWQCSINTSFKGVNKLHRNGSNTGDLHLSFVIISMTTSTCNKANLHVPTVYQLQWVLLTVTLMCCISRSCCRCLKNSTDGGKQSNIRQARLKLCFTTAPSTGIEGWLLPMVLFTSCRDPTIRSLITAEWKSL